LLIPNTALNIPTSSRTNSVDTFGKVNWSDSSGHSRKSSSEESPGKMQKGRTISDNFHKGINVSQLSDTQPSSEYQVLDDDPNVDESVYCVICGRNELVARFMGQTSGLAYNFLMENRG